MPPPLIGLAPCIGWSSIILDGSYIFVHTIGRGLSCGGLTAANGGEEKVDWEPRPMSKHQIVWTIPSNCRTGGIKGVHYFSQMRWPVGFLIFSQLPSHGHNHLVQSLYQTISLWVVEHGPQSFYAKDLAHFLNHTTCEASTSITQEPGWGSKDRDVTLVQKFSNGFSCLIGGHIYQPMFHEMVLEHQDIGNSRWLVWLQHGLNACEINMQEIQGCSSHNGA